ncbi:MAG: tetratricopeptide repeat protein [Actinobacteria bacterium]|uniref:Unannotated protein n=1 Tax=freshwater metagenome TaxID=449393 RepID=A0A6J7CZV9_9ZZZZ|nr:tetratricopeptide repeat protein [Actinomycetota bacterium]
MFDASSVPRRSESTTGMRLLGVMCEDDAELICSEPETNLYELFQEARQLLESGRAEAAIRVLERFVLEGESGQAVLELLGRARFNAGRYGEALDAFQRLLDMAPDDDYAHFGLGMCLWYRQEFLQARDHLAMAFVMRPDKPEYSKALTQVKATLLARLLDGLPMTGPLEPR